MRHPSRTIVSALAACDPQKISELEEGVSTEADVRARFGEPEKTWDGAGGARIFEYNRQPAGARNYMITIGADGNPETVVPGLFAVGEAACVSVHGANRLGSNSLIDLVVFGRATGFRLKELIKPGTALAELPKDSSDLALTRLDHFRNAKGGSPTAEVRADMQKTMQKHAAVFRTSASLTEGVAKMQKTISSFADVKVSDSSLVWNSDLMETLELDNLLGQALITVASGENRHESRGAHAHEDFPDRNDDEWTKHTLAWREGDTGVKFAYRPVHMTVLDDEAKVIPPQKRTY